MSSNIIDLQDNIITLTKQLEILTDQFNNIKQIISITEENGYKIIIDYILNDVKYLINEYIAPEKTTSCLLNWNMIYIHNKICDNKLDLHTSDNICSRCQFNTFWDQLGQWSVIPKYLIYNCDNFYINWLKDNYKKILNNFVNHKQILYLINKLNYDDFNKLFIDYNEEHPIDFLLFIAYIGSNGKIVKLY